MSGTLRFLRSLFKGSDARNGAPRPRPSWPETVERMYDRELSCYGSQYDLVRVVYSGNHEYRAVVIHHKKIGFYKYCIERLTPVDDEAWDSISRDPDALPAMWDELGDHMVSIFGTEQEAWNDLLASSEYHQSFAASSCASSS